MNNPLKKTRVITANSLYMVNKILNCEQCKSPMLKGMHTCGLTDAERKHQKIRNITTISDEALEAGIYESQDARSGKLFGPLFEEYKRRYEEAKSGRNADLKAVYG